MSTPDTTPASFERSESLPLRKGKVQEDYKIVRTARDNEFRVMRMKPTAARTASKRGALLLHCAGDVTRIPVEFGQAREFTLSDSDAKDLTDLSLPVPENKSGLRGELRFMNDENVFVELEVPEDPPQLAPNSAVVSTPEVALSETVEPKGENQVQESSRQALLRQSRERLAATIAALPEKPKPEPRTRPERDSGLIGLEAEAVSEK